MLFPQKEDLTHFARGVAMGSADVVPGVSGGTVALIVGVYERLIAAISRFDARLLHLAASRQWREAAVYVDARFLAALGAGVATALLTLANIMSYLLVHHRSATLAAFFGLILASTVLVARLIRPPSFAAQLVYLLAGVAGAGFAFWLVGLDAVHGAESYGYYFLCGMIAICAMILPGISGAFLLLILGAYEPVTTMVKDFSRFELSGADFARLTVFALGCGIGLIGFAKIIRWLLARWHDLTMAVLCGFMLGSLRRIWPFQHDLTPEIEKLSHKSYENYVPAAWTRETIVCVAIALIALAAVLFIEWQVAKLRREH